MTKILIIYEYFFPARKAGGIVTSLKNLTQLLSSEFEVLIYTSAIDADGTPVTGVISDQWHKINGYEIYYSSHPNRKLFKEVLSMIQPDKVYINGIFSVHFVFEALFILKRSGLSSKTIICPRGMLQAGALKTKPVKKQIYLSLIKLLSLHKRVTWHATDDQEPRDIKTIFGPKTRITVALDTPATLPANIRTINKTSGEVRLCYLSLVTEKKNLKSLLSWLKTSPVAGNLSLDMIGPIKDLVYWEACKSILKVLPKNILCEYKGEVDPAFVSETLSRYHFLILPTLGENFGHVIFEALGAGRPVLISDKTPWNRVSEWEAGMVTPNEDTDLWLGNIKKAIQMDQEDFDAYSKNSRALAEDYIENQNFQQQYNQLFG